MCFFKSRDFVISLEFEKKSWNFFSGWRKTKSTVRKQDCQSKYLNMHCLEISLKPFTCIWIVAPKPTFDSIRVEFWPFYRKNWDKHCVIYFPNWKMVQMWFCKKIFVFPEDNKRQFFYDDSAWCRSCMKL